MICRDDATVIFHAGCWDGFCCAWLMSHWLPTDDSVQWIPANYGDPPPDVEDRNVYILDFSYPRSVIEEMERVANYVTVLDHHPFVERELVGLVGTHHKLTVVYDPERSGAQLTWDHLKHVIGDEFDYWSSGTTSWLVDYTQDRDLWKFELPYSREVNAALRSYDRSFDVWNSLSARSPSDLRPEGEAILRYRKQVIDQHVRFARTATIGDYVGAAVNCTAAELVSDVAGELAAIGGLGCTWVDCGDGMQLWSLRSRVDSIHVGKLAEEYGGGGHPKAAGFRCFEGRIEIGPRITDGSTEAG